MTQPSLYAQALTHCADKPVVTIATGATCAYLGDERNLREFLVADEAARQLRQAGHTVFHLLIDDSLDPLNYRQLRVALDKNEAEIEKYQDWCGKPIGLLPDPFGCHASFAAHFEHALLDRLHALDCHPTLVSTSHLYQRGLYTPYVETILSRHEEILRFLDSRFEGYQPDKLFWPLCPDCGHLDATKITRIGSETLAFHCDYCGTNHEAAFADAKGKLNWKLDCAARWALFGVDMEPFNKAYLEPKAGTFVIAQALCQEFFGGKPVFPLRYGLVKMEKEFSYKLLAALPAEVLRALFVERPASDLTITHDLIRTTAARHPVLPGMSFRSVIEQLLPVWLLTPESLSPSQRALVGQGVAFAEHFMGEKLRLHLPRREDLLACPPAILRALDRLMREVVAWKQDKYLPCDEFSRRVQAHLNGQEDAKSEIVRHLRRILGQERGLPMGRLLFLLPPDYASLLAYLVELCLKNTARAETMPLRLAA